MVISIDVEKHRDILERPMDIPTEIMVFGAVFQAPKLMVDTTENMNNPPKSLAHNNFLTNISISQYPTFSIHEMWSTPVRSLLDGPYLSLRGEGRSKGRPSQGVNQ